MIAKRDKGEKAARNASGGLDLTQGPIVRSVLLFTLPLLASSIIQQLYNTVDMLYAGNVLGPEGIAALGMSTLLVTCLVCFFNGLSIGSTVVVGRAVGGQDDDATRRAIHTSVALSLVGGSAVALLGWIIAEPYILGMNTPAELVDDALIYLRIYFLSSLSVMLYNMTAGVVRALGNSAKAFQAQLIGGITNVVADGLFLLVFGWGIAGLAFASLFSQTVAAAILLVYLHNMDAPYALRLAHLRFDRQDTREVLVIGVPAGTQTLVMALSNVYAQYHINSLGTYPMAAFSSFFKVELILYLPVVAFSQAATAFIAQNLGAASLERAHAGARICAGMGVIWCIAIVATLPVCGRWAFWLFNQEAMVIDYGMRIAIVSFPLYWIYAIQEIYAANIRGWGNSTVPMLIVLANICVLRCIVIAALMAQSPCVESVAYSYPITWSTSAICMLIAYRIITRREEFRVAQKL